jgi:hypothetical protein
MGPGYHEGETFWFYGADAQADFARKMAAKYGGITRANAAWKTTFAAWGDVKIPQPGVRPGPFWADVLTWYRDTKRDFILWQLHDYQAMMARYLSRPIPLIIYVPGRDYSDDDWNQAVATGAGDLPIKLMCDSKFLIQTAAREHCWLQYTASGNAQEVQHLRDYMRQNGFDHIPMWGENAGGAPTTYHPLELSGVVIKYGLYGLDFTHSSALFDADTITTNAVFPELKQAYAAIRAAHSAAPSL